MSPGRTRLKVVGWEKSLVDGNCAENNCFSFATVVPGRTPSTSNEFPPTLNHTMCPRSEKEKGGKMEFVKRERELLLSFLK